MRWNLDLYTEGQKWRGLGFEVSNLPGGRPPLRPEVLGRRRFEIRQSDRVLLQASIQDRYGGVDLVRTGGQFIGVLDPILKSECRAIDAASPADWYSRWAHRFCDGLLQSGNGPIHNCGWRLRPLGPDAASPRPVVDLTGLAARQARPTLGYEETEWSWGISGEPSLIPLRPLSPNDAGNVKAWRKVVGEGLVPPVLAWWVSGLVSWVVIDGHDRLAACEAEGYFPPVLSLEQASPPSPKELAPEQAFLDEKRAKLEEMIVTRPENVRAHEALANDLARSEVRISERTTTTAWSRRASGG